jgi:hypothetical protein
MPPVIRVMAGVALVAMLGTAGVLVYAGVQRYRGRRISRATVRLGAGLEGATSAIGFLFLSEPVFAVLILAVPAYATYWLLQRGHRVATGILLIVLGLPGAAWWGYYLVQDAVDPFVTYDAVLWLWWAPELALIVAGALLMARGDREAPAQHLFVNAATHVRDPAVIGSSILRATAIGPIPIQTLIGIGAALVITGFGLPLAVRAGLPWPAGLIAGTVLFAVIGVELNYLAIPRRVRSAWQGFAVVGNPGMKRWLALVGTPVPNTLPKIRRWLERDPERPEIRWARAEGLLLVGDLADLVRSWSACPLTLRRIDSSSRRCLPTSTGSRAASRTSTLCGTRPRPSASRAPRNEWRRAARPFLPWRATSPPRGATGWHR